MRAPPATYLWFYRKTIMKRERGRSFAYYCWISLNNAVGPVSSTAAQLRSSRPPSIFICRTSAACAGNEWERSPCGCWSCAMKVGCETCFSKKMRRTTHPPCTTYFERDESVSGGREKRLLLWEQLAHLMWGSCVQTTG